MRYHILTTDYDGTIAENEQVSQATLESLVRLKGTGRYLILVTGWINHVILTPLRQFQFDHFCC